MVVVSYHYESVIKVWDPRSLEMLKNARRELVESRLKAFTCRSKCEKVADTVALSHDLHDRLHRQGLHFRGPGAFPK